MAEMYLSTLTQLSHLIEEEPEAQRGQDLYEVTEAAVGVDSQAGALVLLTWWLKS